MKWISLSYAFPPCLHHVLVYKHYIDAEFDQETGGYSDKYFDTPSFIAIDMHISNGRWDKGGVVTHWMELPISINSGTTS